MAGAPLPHDEFQEFVERFNNEEFESCHEALLPAWQANRSDFFKGLIQLAGAFLHWRNGNAFWAEDLFASSYNLLSKYAPVHEGLDVKTLLDEIERCNMVARRAKESGRSGSFPNGTPMPVIRLTRVGQ